jgi:SAM-dependent methyltransferase
MIDPLAGSSWSAPSTVAGFKRSPPNRMLMQFAEEELRRSDGNRLLDIGCGAGRNASPLADIGWNVVGTDLSWPMLSAAAERSREARSGRLHVVLAPMDCLPLGDRRVNMVVAHGIWNLARSAAQFRRAVSEAARVANPGAALFVFTFSRHTLPPQTQSLPGEPFVFTQFSGEPQCFLTETQLIAELGLAGFVQDDGIPIREYNRPQTATLCSGSAPVIYEAVFRRTFTRRESAGAS